MAYGTALQVICSRIKLNLVAFQIFANELHGEILDPQGAQFVLVGAHDPLAMLEDGNHVEGERLAQVPSLRHTRRGCNAPKIPCTMTTFGW